MVPEAEFTSYYGRPIVKALAVGGRHRRPTCSAGGLAAGSALIAAGADLTGRPHLRRTEPDRRAAALAVLRGGPRPRPREAVALPQHAARRQGDLADVGRHLDHHGLRDRAPGSPGRPRPCLLPPARRRGPIGAACRLADRLADRPAGLLRRRLSRRRWPPTPPSCSPTPRRRRGTRPTSELPFVFVGSRGRGLGRSGPDRRTGDETGPVRRLAVGGALLELVAEHRMERSMGITAEPLHTGRAGRLMRAAKALTAARCRRRPARGPEPRRPLSCPAPR